MDSYHWDSNCSSGYDFLKLSELSARNRGSFAAKSGGRSSLSSSYSPSLVLDNESGELVEKDVERTVKKGASDAKAIAALKNHSEAEKRRRERINGHLTTLRGLVPCRGKMDKATLLAGVVSQIKHLKTKAMEAGKGLIIPMDGDEVRVEPHDDGNADGRSYFRASLCCDYRPELLSDLRKALDALELHMVKAEISTLGSRVRKVFVFTGCEEGKSDNAEAAQLLATSVFEALSTVLEKGSGLCEFSPRTALSNKRCRVSFSFDPLSSSSS